MPPKRKSAANRDASPQRTKVGRNVYIVFRGENYEGGRVEALFSSREEARLHAYHWVNDWPGRADRWTQEDADNWRSGCDYIEIQKERIFDTYADWKIWHDSLPVIVIGQQPSQ